MPINNKVINITRLQLSNYNRGVFYMNNTKLLLTISLGVLLSLMLMLAVTSMFAYQSNLARIETIVNSNNLKIHYITNMRTYARERTLSMQKMLLYTDPFERDDEWILFKSHASNFIGLRIKYLNMALSPVEKEVFQKFSKLSMDVGVIQNKISDLILADKDEQARLLLIDKAIPKQDEVFEHMSNILISVEDETRQAAKTSNQEFRKTIYNVLFITFFTIIISILIARFLVKRITSTERQLFNEKERALITLHSIGDGAITTDASGNIENMNDMASLITGYAIEASIGKNIFEVFKLANQSDSKYMDNIWRNVIHKGDVAVSDSDSWMLDSQQQDVAIEFTLAPIFDVDRTISGTILIFKDVSELRSLSTQLAYQAHHDELTGLLNRREFESRLNDVLLEVRRYPDVPYWLAYIDLDQFKVVNDTCGHLAGDELLKQISVTIKQQIREVDHFFRLGGDEFTVILKNCDLDLAKAIVERIRKTVHEFRFCWEDKCFSISSSIGLIEITSNAGNMHDLLSKVDAACYLAKDQGRNRIHLVELNDSAVNKQRGEMDWVHRIRHALDHERFVLYYQQIKPLHNDNMSFHAEILVRLLDDEDKIIPPNAFIPAAERYNLMTEIDYWVVNTTFKFMSKNEIESQIISINLSAQSLCDNKFSDFIVKSISIVS